MIPEKLFIRIARKITMVKILLLSQIFHRLIIKKVDNQLLISTEIRAKDHQTETAISQDIKATKAFKTMLNLILITLLKKALAYNLKDAVEAQSPKRRVNNNQ